MPHRIARRHSSAIVLPVLVLVSFLPLTPCAQQQQPMPGEGNSGAGHRPDGNPTVFESPPVHPETPSIHQQQEPVERSGHQNPSSPIYEQPSTVHQQQPIPVLHQVPAPAPHLEAPSPANYQQPPPSFYQQQPPLPVQQQPPPPVHQQQPPPPAHQQQPPPPVHQQQPPPPVHQQQPPPPVLHQVPAPAPHLEAPSPANYQQPPPSFYQQQPPPQHDSDENPLTGQKRVPSVLLPSEPNEFDTRSISFVFLLPSRGKQCFYHRANRNFTFEYQVTNGGSLDIDVFINSPGGKLAFDRRGKAYGESSFSYDQDVPQDHQMPAYMICLDNRYSSWHDKLVYFNLDVEQGRDARRPGADQLSADLRASLKEMELSWEEFYKSTDKVEDHLLRTIYHLSKSRNNEARDRMMMEGSNSRVSMWSILQLVVMLFVAGIQVLMIRSLFDDKSKLHRVWKSAKS